MKVQINTKGNELLIGALLVFLGNAGFSWASGAQITGATDSFNKYYPIAIINLDTKNIHRGSPTNSDSYITMEQLVDFIYAPKTIEPKKKDKLSESVLNCEGNLPLSQMVKGILHRSGISWVSGECLLDKYFDTPERYLPFFPNGNSYSLARSCSNPKDRNIITVEDLCIMLSCSEKEIMLNNHVVTLVEGGITIGCKTFSKLQVLAAYKYMREYDMKSATYFGEEVTLMNLARLINDLKWNQ